MILWGRPSSVNVQKVLWALDELGLAFEHRRVGGRYGGTDDPAFARLTPVRRVPVLEDGALALWESHAILRHLARREGRLGAGDPVADMWLEFGSTTLQPPFIGLFWQRVRMRPEEQDAAALARHRDALGTALEILEAGLSGGRAFAAGAEFTIADIGLGSLFHRLVDLDPGLVEPHSGVTAWHRRLQERPGYAARVATSYEELKVTP